jgi:hypothetical protein
MQPACPWCPRIFSSWPAARIHVKNCGAAPRPRWLAEKKRRKRGAHMAIIGLTINESGESMQRLAVTTKVAIGEVVKTQTGTRPNKLDHSVFLRKGARSLEWEADPELSKHFGTECRDFWMILLDDEIENVFRTEYAWWSKTEKKCWGDGRAAIRRTEKHPDGEEWTPCGDTCPDLEANRCKPSGDLYFVLADFPRLGSVCRLHTTSYRSIRQLYSALEQIRTVTGGRLAGIRCKLVVRPEKAAYFDEAKKKKVSTTIYALKLELSAQDMQRLVGEMTQYARLFEQTKKLLAAGRKVEYVVEEPEAERAPDVAEEFFPAEEIAPATPAPPVRQPERASAPTEPAAPVNAEILWPKDGAGTGHVQFITAEQRKKFADLAVAHGYAPRQIKEILLDFWRIKSSAEIPADKYDEVTRYFASDGQEKPPYRTTDEDLPF